VPVKKGLPLPLSTKVALAVFSQLEEKGEQNQ